MTELRHIMVWNFNIGLFRFHLGVNRFEYHIAEVNKDNKCILTGLTVYVVSRFLLLLQITRPYQLPVLLRGRENYYHNIVCRNQLCNV